MIADVVPTQSATLSVGGVKLAYTLHGTPSAKPPLILVMGFVMPGKAWRQVLPYLAIERQVLTFDNRGAGQSDKPKGFYTMTQFSRDVLALADALGWQHFHLAGVSMGGMIAQHVALKAPQRLLSLTLIATHAGRLHAVLPTLKGAKAFLQSNLACTSSARFKALGELLFPADFLAKTNRTTLLSALAEDFEPPLPGFARRAQLAAILRHDTASCLHQLAKVRTVIVQPVQDQLIHPRESVRLHRLIPHSKLVKLPEAGHGLIRQCPKRLAEILKENFEAP